MGLTLGTCAVTYSQPGDANFNPAAPLNDATTSIGSLAAAVTSKTGTADARVWTFTVHNNGPGTSTNTTIGGVTLTQSFGTSCGTPVITLPGPLAASPGMLAAGANGAAVVTLDFGATGANCPANARFTVSAQLFNNGALAGTMSLANQTQ